MIHFCLPVTAPPSPSSSSPSTSSPYLALSFARLGRDIQQLWEIIYCKKVYIWPWQNLRNETLSFQIYGRVKIHSFKLFISTIFLLEFNRSSQHNRAGKAMSTSPYFQSDCRPQFAVEGFLFSYFSSTAPVPTRQNTCWIVQMYFEE